MMNMTTIYIPGHRIRVGDFVVTDGIRDFLCVERVTERQMGADSILVRVERTTLHASGECVIIGDDAWCSILPNEFYTVLCGA